jgi:hypothetical protein
MRIVKQVRATLGDALCLSLWADFVTHTNARYMDAIIRPSVALFFVALIGLYHEPSTLPHCPFAL